MSEWGTYLRLLIQPDKEAKITAVTASTTPQKFSTQLSSGNTRKRIYAYNNSNAASGECYYGFDPEMNPSGETQPIPKGAIVDIGVAECDGIDLYFCAASGEVGNLRVHEYA